MRISSSVAIISLLAVIQAATVEFSVISPKSKTVEVDIAGVRTPLTPYSPTIPLYIGTVEVGSATEYKYVSDNIPEGFSREVPSDATTLNQFFGRRHTLGQTQALPRPLDNGQEWTRSDSDPDLFDTNYIPTVFVDGNPADIQDLIYNTPKTHYSVTLTFVGKDYVQTFENVSFSISGAGKKHNPQKQQWRWTLAPGEYIDNRNNFKLRNMEEDPTQMREKLYADCLRAMGTYANQANMARLFINGEGFGTFNMLDDVKKYSYIRSSFYAGNPPEKMGPLYDGTTGSSFDVKADGVSYQEFKPAKGSPEGSAAVHEVALAFSKIDTTKDSDIESFSKLFDVDQFLRFMVMEYLGGSWDNYLMMQTNGGAYKDYDENKWYYLGQDFDGSFGVNVDLDVIELSYKQYPSKYPGAIMFNRLIQNEKVKQTFESYIIDTVKVLFNNNTLGDHVVKYRELIEDDIKWDRSIKQQSPGIKYGWTFKDTYDNLFKGVDLNSNKVGGAAYGLTEWIDKKSKLVIKEFGFSI